MQMYRSQWIFLLCRSPDPSYADSASSILSHFPVCSCGSLTDSCISSHYHQSPSDPPPPGNGFREEAIRVPQNEQLLPPAPEGPTNKPICRKKNKTTTSTTKVSVSRKPGTRRRGAASGKRKSASNKEAKDIDIIQAADQDVDSFDTRRRVYLVNTMNRLPDEQGTYDNMHYDPQRRVPLANGRATATTGTFQTRQSRCRSLSNPPTRP